ncbi:uncharacterized protein VSU04_014966 [Chlamydotis macqueenii]
MMCSGAVTSLSSTPVTSREAHRAAGGCAAGAGSGGLHLGREDAPGRIAGGGRRWSAPGRSPALGVVGEEVFLPAEVRRGPRGCSGAVFRCCWSPSSCRRVCVPKGRVPQAGKTLGKAACSRSPTSPSRAPRRRSRPCPPWAAAEHPQRPPQHPASRKAPLATLGRCDGSIRLPLRLFTPPPGLAGRLPPRRRHPSRILVPDPEEDAEAAPDDADSALRAKHPVPRLCGGLSTDVLHSAVFQKSRHIASWSSLSLSARSPRCNAGILRVARETSNYPLLLHKTESAWCQGADPARAKGCLFPSRIPGENRTLHRWEWSGKVSVGEFPLSGSAGDSRRS